MRTILFTLYEKDYHFGVAALINSLIKNHFSGQIVVGYRDSLPPWLMQLQRVSQTQFRVQEVNIHFRKVECERHFGFHKPFFALEIVREFGQQNCLAYADPDISFLSPWSFVENWNRSGFAVVQDCTFDEIGTHHPWRRDWLRLGEACNLKPSLTQLTYPNSGFFAASPSTIVILESWKKLTLEFERLGGVTSRFRLKDRHEPVVSDQDLLMAALMHTEEPVAFLDRNAMGFKGYCYVMSHAVETPKPWQKCFAYRSLQGEAPSSAALQFVRNCSGPILAYSRLSRRLLQLDLVVAKAISRVYSR